MTGKGAIMGTRTRKYSFTAVGVIGLATGLLLSAGLDWTRGGRAAPEPAPAARSSTESGTVLEGLRSTQKTFTEISRQITPAVVSISAEKVMKSPHEGLEQSPFFEGPFKEFFKRFQPPGGEYKKEGLGSGFIVRSDGYILTNTHVVEGAEAIRVTLLNNTSYEAEVIGTDPTTDVAVIKIDGEDFPAAPLGNSDLVEVGEWVLAIGNPMRLSFTVTAGIVSAKGRNINIIPGSYSIENFIQTDAAINPGNSGGPLVDLNGEVIGINSAISTRTGFYQGYGFAIPINLASRIMEDLIDYKRVIRPILGIQIRNITPELAEALGLKDPVGVLVEDFTAELSPARDAGVQRRDVVVRVDDIPVRQTNELQSLIAQHHPGDVVTLGIIRDRKEKEIRVRLAEKPEDAEIAAHSRPGASEESGRLGLEVKPMAEELADELGIDRDEGVIVSRVAPGSPASEASPFPIRRGDVILEIGRSHRISTPAEFDEIVERFDGGDRVLLYIARAVGGRTSKMYTSIKVPE
jgi:serine protease Do